MRLSMSYFETRPAGQTVARVRELETIRAFLTGQGLFSVIDLAFTVVFIAVMFAYSVPLTLIVLVGLPVYIVIGFLAAAGATRSHQREVQPRGGKPAVSRRARGGRRHPSRPPRSSRWCSAQWEEKLAAYVRTSFAATMLGTGGQISIQSRQQADDGGDPALSGRRP